MDPLETHIDTSADGFQRNREHQLALVNELKEHVAKSRVGGSETAHKRHREQNKLFVRERIKRLLDPDTPFLELSPLAAHDIYDGQAPCAGIVTGIGTVCGRQVMVVANDATVKGGT